MKKLIALIPLLLFAGCATMQAPDTEASVKRVNAEFGAALGRADVAKIMSFYADDAVLLAPNLPPFHGKPAIQQFWTGFLASGKISGTLTTDRLVQSCMDMAVEVGSYELTIMPSGGAPVHDSGKYEVTWKVVGGEWRIVVDMFSSNNPAPH